MSSEELDIFQRIGVKVEDLARWLDVTRQAVTRGMETGEYLTRRRVQVIFSRLLRENPPAAHAFRRELLSVTDVENPESLFDVITVDAIRDRTLDHGFAYRPHSAQEMWIVSAQPRELQPDDYLERRAAELFSRKFRDYRRITPLDRIAYFCPPAIARDLAVVLQRTFEAIPLQDRTDVKIVTSSAFLFSAGYTIYDPYQQGQRGWFMVDPGDLYVPMPHAQLGQVATAFRVAGVACWKPNPARRQSYLDKFIEEQADFEVVEWVVDEQQIPRARKQSIAATQVGPLSVEQAVVTDAPWNPPIFFGSGATSAGSSMPDLCLVFDSLDVSVTSTSKNHRSVSLGLLNEPSTGG